MHRTWTWDDMRSTRHIRRKICGWGMNVELGGTGVPICPNIGPRWSSPQADPLRAMSWDYSRCRLAMLARALLINALLQLHWSGQNLPSMCKHKISSHTFLCIYCIYLSGWQYCIYTVVHLYIHAHTHANTHGQNNTTTAHTQTHTHIYIYITHTRYIYIIYIIIHIYILYVVHIHTHKLNIGT